MFSRRHPYLFFILIFTTIVATATIGMAVLLAVSVKDSDFDFGEKVGIVEVEGIITEAKTTIHHLKRFREDESIKAIVIRIDSPGGAVGPAQEIYREIRKTSGTKKVIASMGTIAASGGYYIAAGTDGIVASPGTITGSIGVVMGFTNYEKLLKKIGLLPIVIKSGEYKDIGSPIREMKDKEQEILHDLAQKIHRQFILDVVEGRKMKEAEVASLADGRIFTGEESKALGLVDRLGNYEDAIEWAGRMGGIEGKISTVYAKDKKFPFFKYLSDSLVEAIVDRIDHPSFFADYLYKPD